MYWVAPFGNPGFKWLFAPRPGLSQLITSFLASKSLGIHRLPLFSYLSCFDNYELKITKQRSPLGNYESGLRLLHFSLIFRT